MKSVFARFGFVLAHVVATSTAMSQVVQVSNAPHPFSVTPPRGWVPGKIVTGNTRIAFNSPPSLPSGECTVTAIVFKGQRVSQAEIDRNLAELVTVKDAQADLARNYNNVNVLSVGSGVLAGFKAQVIKYEYSVGTPMGELWAVSVTTSTVVAPNVSWTIACGATGKSIVEARKAFSHWQMDFNIFPTNFKFQ